MGDIPGTGFQPPTTPAERRAFFDVIRQLKRRPEMLTGEIVAVSPIEVEIDGITYEVESLLPVSVGDEVTILQQGASRLVLGTTEPKIQAGTVDVTFTAEQNSSAAVTFDRAFTATPRITMTVRSVSDDTRSSTLRISTPTTTGFTVLMRLLGTQTDTYAVDWIAVSE